MKVGMLFPGYPSQYVGMGKELYDNSRTIQEYFEEASNCLGMNFVKLCFASSDAELSKVSYAYPALFLSGSSIAHMIQEMCPTLSIDAVAGYGVGEYSALYTANGISFPDGLYLLNKFAQFYAEMHEEMEVKTVIVKGLSDRAVKQLCDEHVLDIASFETERHLISGSFEAVESFCEAAKKVGSGRIKEADAVAGVHTQVLNDLVDQLTIYLTKVDVYDPEISVISATDGKVISNAKKAQESLMRLLTKPLTWKHVLKQFVDYDMLIVPGPSKALVAELSSLYPDKVIMGIETMADLEALQERMHGKAAESVSQVA